MELVTSQLQEGKAYTTVNKNPGYTFIFTGTGSSVPYCYNTGADYTVYSSTGNLVAAFGHYVEATPEEEEWLRDCIKEGRGVPKPAPPTIKNNYSVF